MDPAPNLRGEAWQQLDKLSQFSSFAVDELEVGCGLNLYHENKGAGHAWLRAPQGNRPMADARKGDLS